MAKTSWESISWVSVDTEGQMALNIVVIETWACVVNIVGPGKWKGISYIFYNTYTSSSLISIWCGLYVVKLDIFSMKLNSLITEILASDDTSLPRAKRTNTDE